MPTSSVKSIERSSGTFVLGSISGKIQVWKDYFGSGSDELKTQKKKTETLCQLRPTATIWGSDLGLIF
jgi:hypothetical protein